MNDGIKEQPYAPPATLTRLRVFDKTSKNMSECLVLNSFDDEIVSGNRSLGTSTSAIDVMDLVLKVPCTYKSNIAGPTQITSHGALCLSIPDGATRGGNRRGRGAIDLQMSRSNSSQIASGNYSFCVGGGNTASAQYAAAIGSNNNASGQYAAAIGSTNSASGDYSFCVGFGNAPSGLYSIAMGQNCTASFNYSVAIGYQNISDTTCSVSLGAYATSNGISNKFSFSCNPRTNTNGANQTGIINLGKQTIDATSNVVLKSNTNTAAATNQLTLINNSSMMVHGYVVGQVSATSSVCFEIKALIRRGANAAATVLVGTPTVTQVFADSALTATACSVVADTTYGALAVRVTGIAATTINWNCTLISSEVI